ncbi:Phosphotransferase superclass (chromatophore) [Paulinella micropora]|uniref:Phosphoglucosamine mutase n=1 Tax=Paulinella micropora TaxID=1928728 RepID=A0A1L5YC70_9EUKA|nr:phosphotransferase superclass [Paulinella micropora]AQX45068.1 Phosphotransferase superclass [Paulinella micropora]BBL86279.1 Phosphotransferase superclass [Paulinella micropora]
MNPIDAPFSPVGIPLNPKGLKFGTDGIRGSVNTILTPALAMQIGYWLGKVLVEPGPILIGMDSRNSGPMLVSALSAGLNACGREVWNLGLCPTPAIPGLIRRFSLPGGIMVSGSHNPPQDNGIKMFKDGGAKIDQVQQEEIERKLKGDQDISSKSPLTAKYYHYGCTYERYDLLEFYRNSLLDSVYSQRLDGLKIVLDLCWGSATVCGAELFQVLGADIIALHAEPNGLKINTNCGSTHLKPLQRAVLENGADMGFSFDGDADRMLAVDSQGRILDGDQILYLWGSALMDKDKLPGNKLVATIMSNLAFEKIWNSRGGVLARTSVGDQYVYEAMETTGAALGGEQSGHILSIQNNMSGDGLLTALQVATLIQASGSSLSTWMNSSFVAYPQKLLSVRISTSSSRHKWQQSDEVRQVLEESKTAMNRNGRILIRASGTEPVLRVMVEAINMEIVDYWSKKLVLAIENSFPR